VLSRWSFLHVLEYLGSFSVLVAVIFYFSEAGAKLGGAVLEGATLDGADQANTDLTKVKWQKIKSMNGANIGQVRNAPEGFIEWAKQHGALTIARSGTSTEYRDPARCVCQGSGRFLSSCTIIGSRTLRTCLH
jgi:uncharacterized protein YjbI with pentapeptide repeats